MHQQNTALTQHASGEDSSQHTVAASKSVSIKRFKYIDAACIFSCANADQIRSKHAAVALFKSVTCVALRHSVVILDELLVGVPGVLDGQT